MKEVRRTFKLYHPLGIQPMSRLLLKENSYSFFNSLFAPTEGTSKVVNMQVLLVNVQGQKIVGFNNKRF